jgi:hypothetical protein
MPPITFRGNGRQRRSRNLMSLGCLALGVAALALPLHSGPVAEGRYGAAALFLALALLWQVSRATRVTIDAAGLRTSSAFTKRSHDWSDIEVIESTVSNSDGDRSARVRVQPRDCRAFYLARPSNYARGRSNPEYDREVAAIMEYWRTASPRCEALQPD